MRKTIFGTAKSGHALPASFWANRKATQMYDVQQSVRQTRIINETLSQSSWSADATDIGSEIHQNQPMILSFLKKINEGKSSLALK